jgi:hypothetical protein
MAYNTITQYVGDGVTTDYPIPFSYESQEHVHVNRVDTKAALTFYFVNASLIRLTSPSPSGVPFVIFRDTSVATPNVSWETGASIRSGNLNSMSGQFLKTLQELKDSAGTIGAFAPDLQPQIYNLKVTYPGIPANDSVIVGDVFSRRVAFPYDAVYSRFKCVRAPYAEYTLSIKKNDVEVGTIVFDADETTAVVSFIEGFDCIAGDMLTVVTQSTLDVIKGIYGTISGIRV